MADPPAASDERQRHYSHATFSAKNQDILNDVSSHCKLARSVLKIASFEFANLQCFNSTFMNFQIARLDLNAKCQIAVFTQSSLRGLFCDKQNIVHLVAFIYMLTSSEDTSKNWENVPFKTSTSFCSPWRTSQSLTKASFFPINSSIFRKHVCQQCPGIDPGYANA